MACSPVSVISLIMDRALHLVIAKVRVRYPLKPGFFQVLFSSHLGCSFNCKDHVHFEVHCLHESFLYQIDLILSLIDYDAQLLGYYMQALLQACLLTNFDKPLRHL